MNDILKENNKLKRMIISVYTIGVIGIFVPYTATFFVSLTPIVLLLSFVLLMLNHNGFDIKTILIYLIIFSAGLIVEMIGVNSGKVFGIYHYGETLGPKIANTPLLMGLNWILMIYMTASIVTNLKLHPIIKITFSSVLMLIYDLILEKIAPKMDMWYWDNSLVPFQNYAAWFILSVVFQSLLVFFKIDSKNKLSLTFYVSQLVFFVLLLFKN